MQTKPTTEYAYWQYTATKPTQNHAYLWPGVLRAVRKHSRDAARLLDAGCGSGAFCEVARKEMGLKVCGCDLSESGIALAREHFPECRFECLSVYDDLVRAFGTTWDVIVSIEVVEHLYDPQTFLSRIRESLVANGLFVLTTPYHGYLKNLLIAASGGYDRHHNPLNTGGHIKFWSRKTLVKAMEETGFRIVQFDGAGRFPGLWKSMIIAAYAA